MTRIDFYVNAADKLDVARRLAIKVHQAGQCALLYTADPGVAEAIDQRLWTQDKLSFVPHVRCGHPRAGETPILIGTDPAPLARHDVLINLDATCPEGFGRFERLLELASQAPDDLRAARGRYRHYQDRGYPLTSNDLSRK